MPQSHFDIDPKKVENRLTKLEILYIGTSKDISYIKKSLNNHITTLTKRITDLENEMAKRWSRPEAVGLGILMSVITALIIYIITK